MSDEPAKYKLADGTPLPRVSGVLDEWGIDADGLQNWALFEQRRGNCHIEIRDEAATIGTASHALIENFLDKSFSHVDVDDDHRERVARCVALFVDWHNRYEVKPLFLELEMVSDTMLVGGTADFIGWIDGVFMLVDWKTSSKHRRRYQVQLAAYAILWEAQRDKVEGWQPLEAIGTLRLSKKEGDIFEFRTKDDWESESQIFTALTLIYHQRQDLKLWPIKKKKMKS